MKLSFAFGLISLTLSISTHATDLDDFAAEAMRRCGPIQQAEEIFTQEDFGWGMSQTQMLEKAERLYNSGKRLKGRAYYDAQAGEFIMNLDRSENNRVRMPIQFAYSVKRHIEEGLKRDYVQVVTFTDMGHSHFLVPQEAWDNEIGPIPPSEQNRTYEAMLNHPGLKILYHTAEQLKMKDENNKLLEDEFLKWRYYTRNLVGDNRGEGRMEIHKELERNFNTVGSAEGYRYWGGGFYVNATQNGCFFYEHKGEKYYFDLSFHSLPINNSAPFGSGELPSY